MNKKTKKLQSRLSLTRETVRHLDERELTAATGAGASLRSCTVPFTHCPLCDPFP